MSAPSETDDAPEELQLGASPLPRALAEALELIFASLAVDARLLCAAVCPAWRALLTQRRSLWARLDLLPTSGVTSRVTDALLKAAAARAHGGLCVLDVSGCGHISFATLLDVVTVNSAALCELRMRSPFSKAEEAQERLAYAVGNERVRVCDALEELLRAAPQLRALHTGLPTYLDVLDAGRMLRHEGVFRPLQLLAAGIDCRGVTCAPDGTGGMPALLADVAACHTLVTLQLDEAALDTPAAQEALVAAAMRLQSLVLHHCTLTPALADALARIVNRGALTELHIVDVVPASMARLCDALRASRRLRALSLIGFAPACWREPGMHAVLAALCGHPTLHTLTVSAQSIPLDVLPTDEEQALAAAHIAALIAANAPALTSLDMSFNRLTDAAAAPLIAAVRRNSHLRMLDHAVGNEFSGDVSAQLTLPVLPGDE
jgi:hypothetical protein